MPARSGSHKPEPSETKIVESFRGSFWFLSNFYPILVWWAIKEGFKLPWPSSEHAYQAAKCLDREHWDVILACKTAKEAKRAGSKRVMAENGFKLRPDWDDVKLDIMLEIVFAKFQDDDLCQRLLDTGDALLQEGNWWGDRFWGTCDGEGENHLGKILMTVRSFHQGVVDDTTDRDRKMFAKLDKLKGG